MMQTMDLLPECPFYQGEFKRAVKCEGVTEESFLKLCFPDEKALKIFRDYCCYSKHWERCPIAKMLNKELG